ncbi:MAG: caspase family protein [Hyphomicrobium sp.]
MGSARKRETANWRWRRTFTRARRVRWCLFLVCLLASTAGLASALRAETRIALVVGNAAYSNKPLHNARHDGELMADTLKDVGFEVITALDANPSAMRSAITEFGRRLKQPDTVALFYYAGHGVQSDGRNYLIPVGADIGDMSEVAVNAVALDDVMKTLVAARTRLNIVILDACRDNPFGTGRAFAEGGLAPSVAPWGTFIGYATAPGQIARDGEGNNSPYTAALAFNIPRPGSTLEEVFRDTRRAVLAATGGQQVPWEHSSLVGAFYFKEKPATPESSADRQVHTTELAADARIAELDAWERIKLSQNPQDFKAHMTRFPNGLFYELAAFKLSHLAPDSKRTAWRWVITGSVARAAEPGHAGPQLSDHAENAGAAFERAVVLEGSASSGQDWEKVVALYQEAAEGGVPRAMFETARAYDKGRGVSRDLAKAAYWYGRAAENGHAAAMASLGTMYEFGEGVPASMVDALQLYQMASAAGDAAGTTSLAYLLAEGKGAARNEKQARKLYAKAAAEGHSRALFNLALMELQGRGGRRDTYSAVRHLREAADKDHAGALEELAQVYDQGIGVRRDPARAAAYIVGALKAAQKEGRTLEIFRRRWSTATRRELQRLNSTQGLYSAMGEEPTAQTRWALSRMVMP